MVCSVGEAPLAGASGRVYNGLVKTLNEAPPPAAPSRPNLATLGTACCIGSSICYTAANICLRQLAGWDVHPAWVIAVKEMVTVAVVGPFLLWLAIKGKWSFRDPVVLAVLVATGVGVQLAGNMSVQWAFGVVGLTVSTPTAMGVMLVASGMMGVIWLGERVTHRSALAISLLVVAVALLAIGTWIAKQEKARAAEGATVAANTETVEATMAEAERPSLGKALLGVGAAALAGTMFAALAAAVRFAGARKAPVSVIVFVITGMGVVACGLLSLNRIGVEGMVSTPPDRLGWMIASGVFNLLGFLLITKGLQLTTLVHANVINASQVALAAVAGMLFFREPSNGWLVAGILLTVVGIFQIGSDSAGEEAMEAV